MIRKINDMFHTDEEGYLVKSSNGERVPADEPVFILRARDVLAVDTLYFYTELLIKQRPKTLFHLAPHSDMRIYELGQVVGDFLKFKREHPERMKVPGVTQGK